MQLFYTVTAIWDLYLQKLWELIQIFPMIKLNKNHGLFLNLSEKQLYFINVPTGGIQYSNSPSTQHDAFIPNFMFFLLPNVSYNFLGDLLVDILRTCRY